MKNLTTIFTLALITISSAAMAQDTDLPAKGAKLFLANNNMEITSTGEQTFDLWVVRSSKAKRVKFEVPKFSGSEDLDISIVPNPENRDNYKVTVKTKDVASGKYFYTITSNSNYSYKSITGTTASFTVVATKSVASAKGN